MNTGIKYYSLITFIENPNTLRACKIFGAHTRVNVKNVLVMKEDVRQMMYNRCDSMKVYAFYDSAKNKTYFMYCGNTSADSAYNMYKDIILNIYNNAHEISRISDEYFQFPSELFEELYSTHPEYVKNLFNNQSMHYDDYSYYWKMDNTIARDSVRRYVKDYISTKCLNDEIVIFNIPYYDETMLFTAFLAVNNIYETPYDDTMILAKRLYKADYQSEYKHNNTSFGHDIRQYANNITLDTYLTHNQGYVSGTIQQLDTSISNDYYYETSALIDSYPIN